MGTEAVQDLEPETGTDAWAGFNQGLWRKEVDVRDFIQQNYKPYEGDEKFLSGSTERTRKIWDQLNELFLE